MIVAASAALWVRQLPNTYRSETLILVVPQRVPESYVRSTVTARIEDRLQTISQQIMSRTRLEQIVQDFNLYPQERADARAFHDANLEVATMCRLSKFGECFAFSGRHDGYALRIRKMSAMVGSRCHLGFLRGFGNLRTRALETDGKRPVRDIR